MFRTFVALTFWGLPIVAIGQIHFTESSQIVGLNFIADTYRIGSGISIFDFDNDGDDDVTLCTEANKPMAFYQNHLGKLRRIPPPIDHTGDAKQVLWVDYDNDGDSDLFITTFDGPNRLYEQRESFTFIDVTEAAGLLIDNNLGYGATWGDYNRDGWLDLYVNERIFNQDRQETKHRLYKNKGDRTFLEVGESTYTRDPGKIPFCSTFFDANNDKWPDIYTANDKLTLNTLLINQGNGTFWDTGTEASADLRMNAMCVAIGDYNNDGWQDIYVSNTPIGNAMLHNTTGENPMKDPSFREVADSIGVGFYGNGWGSNFLDADNDGDLDLYVSGSKIGRGSISSLFYENLADGSFIIPEAGFFEDTTNSFSNSLGDINGDGLVDILVQNNPPFYYQLWLNQSTSENNWIKIKLEGVKSNRDAIGAKIEVFVEELYSMRYLHCGIGFLAQNSLIETIGLGKFTKADSIRITWPTGHQDKLFDVETPQTLRVVEGSSTDGIISQDPDITLTFATLTSNALTLSSDLSIYPNPSKSSISITDTDVIQPESYRIFNSLGVEIRRGTLPDKNMEIPTSDLPAGMYFLSLYNRKKLLKHIPWLKS
ncbi:MAG: FG-GAP-like repeat-containing protein [Bacteroidota bacterium]